MLREQQRPGRFPGTAYGHFKSCHAHGLYDVEVDTGALSPSDCTQRVERALQADDNTAFDRLRAMICSKVSHRQNRPWPAQSPPSLEFDFKSPLIF